MCPNTKMKQVLFFSLLLFTLHGTTANLIHATCRSASRDNQNVKYSFCKSSLLSIPPAQRSNLQKFGIASINLIQKNVAATIGDINKQLKKKGLKRDVQRSITACLELYTQTIDDLSDAVENYKSKSFYDVTQDVSATSVAATACEDGFKEREVVSTLTTRNDDMGQLASIVLNIVDLYEKVS